MKKTIGKLLLMGGSTSALSALVAAPAFADGLGWSANQMIQDTNAATGVTGKAFSQESFAGWVKTFTTWILGIAIVMFVLKVVLTAVDRMMFSGKADGTKAGNRTGGGFLSQIPFVGAYDPTDYPEWKLIWIHFGKQLAVVAGAWLFVQVIASVILFAFEQLSKNQAG